MEDSFENRLAGHTPEPVNQKRKSGKGWMICFFITLVLLIGVGVFAGILFFNKGDDGKAKIAELEDQIKEKDEKIEKCEETPVADTKCDTPDSTPTSASSDIINFDYTALKNAAKKADDLTDYTDIKISMYDDKKYIIAGGQANDGGYSGYYLYMYKENKDGAAWKKLAGTQNVLQCSELTQEQKTAAHGILSCADESGTEIAL